MASREPEWPPPNGVQFIRSEAFGEMLVTLVKQLAGRYPHMDFTDAVAQVFIWFDGRLARNRRFINAGRFPTVAAFRAYLRQAVWNAARLAERVRQRHGAIEALPVDAPITSRELDPAQQMALQGLIDALPDKLKAIFQAVFFEEEEPKTVADKIDRPVGEVHRLFGQAVDQIAIHEAVESLPEPHKTVFEKLFMEDEDLDMLASTLDRTVEEVETLFDEAADMLVNRLS